MLGEPSLLIVLPCLDQPSTKTAGTNRTVGGCNSWALQKIHLELILQPCNTKVSSPKAQVMWASSDALTLLGVFPQMSSMTANFMFLLSLDAFSRSHPSHPWIQKGFCYAKLSSNQVSSLVRSAISFCNLLCFQDFSEMLSAELVSDPTLSASTIWIKCSTLTLGSWHHLRASTVQ